MDKSVNGIKFARPDEECLEAIADAARERIRKDSRAQHLFGVYVRALRNCDWDGRIWCYLTEGERDAWRKVAAE